MKLDWQRGVRWTDRNSTAFWVLAVGLYGAYDVAAALLGARVATAIAGGAVTTPLFPYDVGWMLAAKALVFAVCVVLWRLAPRRLASGVPLGLAIMGVLTAAWDTWVIVGAILA